MPSGKSAEADKSNPYAQIFLTNARYLSNLHHWMAKRPDQVRYLRITRKRGGGWYAILGVTDDNREEWTAFGSGTDYVEAMRALNGAVAAANWKVEKFPSKKT